MSDDRLDLVEIFSSIQGEGPLVGRRQIFLRLCGCNLDCTCCDTPTATPPSCTVETDPETGASTTIPNPVSHDQIVRAVTTLTGTVPRLHHSISITGGEPLCQTDRLIPLLPRLAAILPLFLETNGTLPDRLHRVIGHLTHVSMDIKLTSPTGIETPWGVHDHFLAVASRCDLSVKVVVNRLTTPDEIRMAARLVTTRAPAAPLILQPETTDDPARRIGGRGLLTLQRIAAELHPDVRVIPQTHRLMGVP